jgi:hypothetical protein
MVHGNRYGSRWSAPQRDVLADSIYDAAHLFMVEAKQKRAVSLPKPSPATIFEVVTEGKLYRVRGVALQRWIVERRQN